MYQYLIVKCEELSDQYECDANRIPILMTNDITVWKEKNSYEIYEVGENGKLTRIKDYEDVGSNWGMAVYMWDNDDDGYEMQITTPDHILASWSKMSRDDFLLSVNLEEIKDTYGFDDDLNEMYSDINCCGAHAEDIDDKWVVIGEYFGDYYPCGY